MQPLNMDWSAPAVANGKDIVARLVQPEKTLVPMYTAFGIFTSTKLVQLENTEPIDEFGAHKGRVTVARLEHPEKALPPTDVTLE